MANERFTAVTAPLSFCFPRFLDLSLFLLLFPDLIQASSSFFFSYSDHAFGDYRERDSVLIFVGDKMGTYSRR